MGSGKTTHFCFACCRTRSPRMARATNSCTPHGGLQGGRRESSLLTFAALLVTQKYEKRKASLCLYTAAASLTLSRRRRPHLLLKSVNSRPTMINNVPPTAKRKNICSIRFSFCYHIILFHLSYIYFKSCFEASPSNRLHAIHLTVNVGSNSALNGGEKSLSRKPISIGLFTKESFSMSV